MQDCLIADTGPCSSQNDPLLFPDLLPEQDLITVHKSSNSSAPINDPKTMNSSLAKNVVTGPATEALEQQMSKKRRLSFESVEETPASNALSFEFDAMFGTVSPDCEAFPTIAWDFDDEVDSHFNGEAVLESLTPKRVLGQGMLRSKSVKRDLASLDVDSLNDSLNTRVSLASIASISVDKMPPLGQFSLGYKVDRVPIFGKSTASGSLRSSSSRRKSDLGCSLLVRSGSLRTIRTHTSLA
jgi:hypothetical protein